MAMYGEDQSLAFLFDNLVHPVEKLLQKLV